MKSVLKFALALSVFAGLMAAEMEPSQAATTSGVVKPWPKITRKWQLHDGCHSRYAQMRGKPCH